MKGLFYGGGGDQLVAQLIGSLTCVVVVTCVALAVMYVIRSIRGTWSLPVERDSELEGLDIFEHGITAYTAMVDKVIDLIAATAKTGEIGDDAL